MRKIFILLFLSCFISLFACYSGLRVRNGVDSQYFIGIKEENPDITDEGEAEPPSRHDLIITEIMADPNPAVGLPEVEYVEIYNRSDKSLDLSYCLLFVGDNYGSFTPSVLNPGEYAVLCAEKDADALAEYGNVVPIKSFKTLINDGRVVYIVDLYTSTVVTWLDYNLDWYGGNMFKRDGGWSLERHDTDNLHINSMYWSPSESSLGGTPGQPNSVSKNDPDNMAPYLKGYGFYGNDTVFLWFNKEISTSTPENAVAVTGNAITEIYLDDPKWDRIFIVLQEPLEDGAEIVIDMSGIVDVSGFVVPERKIVLRTPSVASSHDVVFNEILFEPKEGEPKFVELLNRSDKTIDMSALYMAKRLSDGNLSQPKRICEEPIMLNPEGIIVLTTDIDALKKAYSYCEEAYLSEMSLSEVTASGADILIVSRDGTVIDELNYSPKWHHPWLNDTHGVSLERINSDVLDNSSDNWHSAASTVDFATPGCLNSHSGAAESAEKSDKPFWIEKDAFTPDNDGWGDLLEINYDLPSDGYTCSITIYSRNGEKLGYVINNELLDKNGTLHWNGTDGQGGLLPVGVYVLIAEALNPEGDMINIKMVAVLAGR